MLPLPSRFVSVHDVSRLHGAKWVAQKWWEWSAFALTAQGPTRQQICTKVSEATKLDPEGVAVLDIEKVLHAMLHGYAERAPQRYFSEKRRNVRTAVVPRALRKQSQRQPTGHRFCLRFELGKDDTLNLQRDPLEPACVPWQGRRGA